MKIPKFQSDIKLSTYLKYEEYIKNLTDKQRQNLKVVMKNTIKIFYDISDKEFNSKPYTQILDMYKIIENILNTKQSLVRTFKIEDVEYGLLPDFNDMTFGELVDLDVKNNDVLKQICVLYRPIIKKKGEKYNIAEYEGDLSTYELFKENLSLDVYNGFIDFFLRIQKSLENYTQKYLEKQMKHLGIDQQ